MLKGWQENYVKDQRNKKGAQPVNNTKQQSCKHTNKKFDRAEYKNVAIKQNLFSKNQPQRPNTNPS